MGTYEAAPDGDARGAVIVLHEAFGVTPHIESVTRRLAALGWLAIAPALFHRVGTPVFAYDAMVAVGKTLGQLSRAGIQADVAGAISHLERSGFGPDRIGLVGFCLGGTASFL